MREVSNLSHENTTNQISVEVAMEKLVEGNRRFVTGTLSAKDLGRDKREDLLKKRAAPVCGDSHLF
jgi:hypothetical protein